MVDAITVGQIEFATTPRDPQGDDWVALVSDLEGWWEPAPDETDSLPHPSGVGTVETLPRLGSRSITLRGQLIAETVRGHLSAKAALARLRHDVMRVDEGAGLATTEANVRRAGSPRFVDLIPTASEFTISFTADDPLRYSGSSTLGPNGGIFLQNRGDAVAYPILELNGPQGTVGIAHPRGLWTLTPTPEGRHRIVDLRNGDVWESGARVFRQEQGPAPVVLPGGSVWVLTGLGAGQAIVRRHEAWT